MSAALLRTRLESAAYELGFDAFGVAPAEASPRAADLLAHLTAGRHAGMDWLARDPERRADPRLILPGARSVLVVGLSYFTENPPETLWNNPLRGRIARYAWGRDYHNVLRKMLRKLAARLAAESPGADRRAFADSGPVMEHEVAVRAGLGFTGRNTLLLHPRLGSYLHLGVLLTTAEIEPDPTPSDPTGAVWSSVRSRRSCGTCRRCLEVCPTGAFTGPYRLDARRCIAYHTIENPGEIPVALRPAFVNWIFGCDACQSVCPWVRKLSTPGTVRHLDPSPDRMAPLLPELLDLDEEAFRQRFAGTPLMRPGWRGMRRNAIVALGNSGSSGALPALRRAAGSGDPLLEEHARWALARLDGGDCHE